MRLRIRWALRSRITSFAVFVRSLRRFRSFILWLGSASSELLQVDSLPKAALSALRPSLAGRIFPSWAVALTLTSEMRRFIR